MLRSLLEPQVNALICLLSPAEQAEVNTSPSQSCGQPMIFIQLPKLAQVSFSDFQSKLREKGVEGELRCCHQCVEACLDRPCTACSKTLCAR